MIWDPVTFAERTLAEARRLHELTGLPVLGAVSMTWMERYDAQVRSSAWRLSGAMLGMVLVCGVYLVTQRHLANAVRMLMV